MITVEVFQSDNMYGEPIMLGGTWHSYEMKLNEKYIVDIRKGKENTYKNGKSITLPRYVKVSVDRGDHHETMLIRGTMEELEEKIEGVH